MPSVKKEVKDLKRLEKILSVFFKYELASWFGNPVGKAKPSKRAQAKTKAQRLRLAFEELGGTFIKLGQLLSLRPDLVSREYSEEFAKLQDNVKPVPFSQIKHTLETDFRKSLSRIFKTFDPKPIAAASIGQVHRAMLHSGQQVAVKIKRHGIKELFETDIDLLYYLANKIKNKFELVDPVQIVDEFRQYTEHELDYIHEAKNIDKFYQQFKADPITKIPKLYWEYTTPNVLTMEYIAGTEISDKARLSKLGYNPKKIAENLVDSIFKQIFIHGVFHADPHPANVFALKDNKIALLDFGIVGFLDDSLKQNSADLFCALINADVEFLAECLLSLGFIDAPINMDALKADLVENLGEYRGTTLKYLNLSDLFHKILAIARKYHIKLPVNFVLMGKAIITVESSCAILYPEFNLLAESKPFVKKLEAENTNPKIALTRILKHAHKFRKFLSRLPEQSEQLLMEFKDTDRTIKDIHKDIQGLTKELGKAANHLIFGIIVVALIIGGVLLMPYDQAMVMGIPKYTFIYLSIAGIIMAFLLISNLRGD
ncbi:MAG: AarF/ABC1/UbiB kinase family protein [Candidatus Woesearchaeota archaeon]